MSYIVPMKKPICINCPFRSLDSCTLIYLMSDKDSEVTVHVNEMTVSPDCPLIELPPHGRLGDLDALYAEISNGNKAYNGIDGYDGEYPNIADVDDCLEAIKYADTVIEAERSETDA